MSFVLVEHYLLCLLRLLCLVDAGSGEDGGAEERGYEEIGEQHQIVGLHEDCIDAGYSRREDKREMMIVFDMIG